jgi:uncharacterized protein YodC (DUF2158 family)
MKLQQYDVVRLKSGGPEMTIARFETNGAAVCGWFVGKRTHVQAIPVEMLAFVRR